MIFMLSFALAPSAWAVCSNPAGAGGDIIYNGDENVMSYCDDTNWIAVRGTKENHGYIAPTSSLVGHWTLDETSGSSITDNSGNGNTGTWTDGADNDVTGETVPGQDGTALDFDNIDNAINAGSDTNLDDIWSGGGTISAWIYGRSDGEGGYGRIVDKSSGPAPNNGWDLYVMDDPGQREVALSYDFTGADADFRTNLLSWPLNTWFHVVVTYDNGSDTNDPKFYINGVEHTNTSKNAPTGSAVSDAAYNFTIGNRAGATDRTFDGYIDDVRAYNTILSASDVEQLYLATGGTDTSLIGHWKLDETSGTTAADSSGNGNDGTMTGGLDAGTDSVTGKINTALNFDGDDEINISNSNILEPTLFTVAAWVRPVDVDSPLETQGIYKGAGGNGNDVSHRMIANNNVAGRVEFRCDNNASGAHLVTVNGVLSDNTWTHLAMTWDGTQITGYVDGISVGSDAVGPGCGYTNSDGAQIGDAPGTQQFNGDIDDVRLYDRALSAAEIGALAAACEEGNMIYNDDHMVPQYCAGGDTWTAMGPVRDGIDSGLVGHWEMEDASGGAVDSINSNNASEAGSGTYTYQVDGKIGNAIQLNQDPNPLLNAGNASELRITGAITVAGWLKKNTASSVYLVSKRGGVPNRGYRLEIRSAGEANFSISPDGTNLEESGWSTTATSVGEWHHVVGVYEPSTRVAVYIDGVLESENTTSISPSIHNSTQDFIISGWTNGGGSTIDGSVDDIRVYDRAISEAEIMALYELGNNNPSSLDLYWKLDELSGTTAVDSSGKGINGTLNNFDTPPAWTSAGIVGGSLLFDGTDDYIDSSVSADFSAGGYTLSSWVKTTTTSDGRIFSKLSSASNQKWLMYMPGLDRVECGLSDGAVQESFLTGASVNDGQWHHIACVVDTSNIQVYVDGVAGTSGTHDNTLITNGANWEIGRNNSDLEHFNGHMDEVRVYAHALSPTEIDALYKKGIGHCTNPVGKEGDLIYNDDAGVDALQYCDGANWQAVGKSP